jgi:hypothetical protein
MATTHLRRNRIALPRAAATAATLLAFAATITLAATTARADTSAFVSGTSNIFGAGHATPPAPAGGGAGVLPPEFDLPAGTGRIVTFSASGIVHYNASLNIGPDGQGSPSGLFVNSTGGISGIKHDTVYGYLVGVFLTGAEPADPPPASLDFTEGTGIGRNFTTFSPAINQTFFIGDGLTGTGSGTVQQFNVPDSATRLFLGFADTLGPPGGNVGAYGDNSGGFNVTIAGVVPEPSSAFMVVIAAGWQLARRRRRAAFTTAR